MNDDFCLLEVVPYYAPAWAFGGPPRVMSDEARELARRGHEVHVFTTDALDAHHRAQPIGRNVEDGVVVHRFPNVSNRAAFHRYRFQPRGMRRALREAAVDVVHLSELRHELAILTWREVHRRDLPLAVSAHGTLPRRGGLKGRIRHLYDAAWVEPMLHASALLIAQTSHEADMYLDYGADPASVHVVPLGIDPPPPPCDEPPPDLGVPDGARMIMFLGRIHPLKGVERLIRGFATAADRHDDLWLVIAGRDDGGEPAARALADELGLADRVTFPGPLYGTTRYEAYRRADLFAITPTHFEETSLASLEAASVGTPLLLGAEAEAPYLEQYGAGAIVPAAHEVGPTLLALLETDLATAGKEAARMISERHDWARVGDTLEQHFAAIS